MIETKHKPAPMISISRRVIHWLIALLAIVLVGGGLWMTRTLSDVVSQNTNHWLIVSHKIIGILVLLLSVIRLVAMVWGKGFVASSHSPFETFVAHAVQAFFLTALIALPITGMLMHKYSGGTNLFWIESLAPPRSSLQNPELVALMSHVHTYLSWGMVTALTLHVAGALKHHFMDADNTLTRMSSISVRHESQNKAVEEASNTKASASATFGRVAGVIAVGVLAIGAGLIALAKEFSV